MKNLMLIDASHPEETRLVITENHYISEYDFAIASKKQIKGNIYLAKVIRVEPSLQAAFVEYGGNRQGFLPFAEIHPDYYQIPVSDRQKLLEEEESQYQEEQEKTSYARDSRRRHRRQRIRKSDAPAETIEGGVVEEALYEAESDAVLAAQESVEASEDLSSLPLNPDVQTEPSGRDEAEVEAEAEERTDIESIDIAENNETHGDPLLESESDDQERKQAEAAVASGEYEQVGGNAEEELRPTKKFRFQKRYRIQEVIKKGQVILVQTIKDERGNKGAAVSTYISLPGRYCVLMPNTMRAAGISRRISDPDDRKRLKSITDGLETPKGMSVIIRTAGLDRSRPEIKRDYEYLMKLWATIRENTLSSFAPALIYEEADLIKRALRDYYTQDIDEILVEGEEAFKSAKELMKVLMPSHAAKVKQHTEEVPVFQYYGVDSQLALIHEPQVKLRSGGYVVFNSTEALVAVDVNSGRSTGDRHIEETATRTNLEAAQEIARQVRMRDLAGLIVIDFIDMMDLRNRKIVEKALKEALKSDRAKIQIGRISTFGLLEMSRQRLRPSITESIMSQCAACSGTGLVKTTESLALEILRKIEGASRQPGILEINISTTQTAAVYLLNRKREVLSKLESALNIKITIGIVTEVDHTGFTMEVVMHPDYKEDKSKRRRKPGREQAQISSPQPARFGENHSDDSGQQNMPIEEGLPEAELQDSITEGSPDATPKRQPRRRERPRKQIKMRTAGKPENSTNSNDNTAPEELEQRETVSEIASAVESEVKAQNVSSPLVRKAERKSNIQKVAEFKAREPKQPAKEEMVTEEPVDANDSARPRRSGWWSKLIRTE